MNGPARLRDGLVTRLRAAPHALSRTVRPGGAGPVDVVGVVRGAVARPSRRAVWADALLGLGLAVPVVAGTFLPVRMTAAWWAQAAGLAMVAAAVLVARAFPVAALLLMSLALPLHGNFVFAFPVMAYLAGRRTQAARPVLWVFVLILLGGATLNLARGVSVTVWFPLTVWLVLLGVLPWLAGRAWRQYQQLVYAGWQRAEQLEREQRIAAERERLRERARIAQEMHDSLGHELALIAVRAGALQVAPGLEERHRRAAAELRAGAAEATAHLREIIGVLREDAGAAPQGGGPVRPAAEGVAEGVAELVQRARSSGVRVTLAGEVAGEVAAAAVAPMAALAVYRVVQEAITNAVKHAPGAAVAVRLDGGHDGHGGLRVEIVNGPAADEGTVLAGGGHGLTGLAERVRVAGGTLRAGPTGDGGFQVVADLPATPPLRHPDQTADQAAEQASEQAAEQVPARVADRGGVAAGGSQVPGGVSESALVLARERRRVRRGLADVIMVPAGLLAVLATVMVGYYVHATMNSVLRPADFAALHVGQERARVQPVLPDRQVMSSDAHRVSVPEPPGAECRYYRPDANLLGLGMIYRLCFTGDRLSHKDAFHTAVVETPRDDQDPRSDGTR